MRLDDLEKQERMRVVELIDAWRVVPRVMVLAYGFVCWQTFAWFTGLPDPSTAQTTFATGIWGAAAAWFGFYVNSGRKW